MEASRPLPVHTITSLPAPPTCVIRSTNLPKLPVYIKMEALIREMQDAETGVPIRSQKLYFTSIPNSFMGYDLIEWLIERLEIEESHEAIHLGNLFCQHGYIFPVGEFRSLVVKDDSSLYRFQTPYYWPSQNHTADTVDYAIYLTKRHMKGKQKYGLEEFEIEVYNKLKKGLQHKWEFVVLQAEEQTRLAKDRKKADKIVTDSQERAYWRVYRPPLGFPNCLETAPVPDKTNMANRVRKKSAQELSKDIETMTESLSRTRSKGSVVNEALVVYSETFWDYDPFLCTPNPSNPWVTDEEEYWLINDDCAESPSEIRVKRWAINFWELISDPLGLAEFTNYMRKEYAHENIRFWQAVNELRHGTSLVLNETVESIFEEFLKPGAPCEINIDGKTMEETQQLRKQPTRYTYDLAAEHVYVLNLKKDCYPRFLRSEDYKNLVATAVQPSTKKQRFFHIKSGPGKKKISTTANCLALVPVTPQPIKRLGSDETSGYGSGKPPPFDDPGGGIHMGGSSTYTPPQSSNRVDCDPPYRGDLPTSRFVVEQTKDQSGSYANDTVQEQSEVCPWDSAPNPNICPWENTEPTPPPSTAPTTRAMSQQHSSLQLQTQQSFRVDQLNTGSGSKGKPPDRSISVDVSTLSSRKSASSSSSSAAILQHSGASVASHLTPASSSGDAKVTLNICPWEEQEAPQKQAQYKAKSSDNIDSYSELHPSPRKGSSTTSIPSIIGTSHEIPREKSPSGSVRSYHERRPSVHLDKKAMIQEDLTSYNSPSISLQDLSATKSHLFVSEIGNKSQKLSREESIAKGNSNLIEHPFHRELSASISVPCTSVLTKQQQQDLIDYSVKSGHHGPPVTSELDSSGNILQISTSSNKKDKLSAVASVPYTLAKRSEPPRTVSVSSQTQTDPMVYQKTNQQTQHPARDSIKYPSKHSSRQSKHGSLASQQKARQQYHQKQPYIIPMTSEERMRQGIYPQESEQQTRQYYITRESVDQPKMPSQYHGTLQNQEDLDSQQQYQIEEIIQQQQKEKQQYEMHQKLYEKSIQEKDLKHIKEMQQYEQQMQEFQEQQTRYQEKRVQELASIHKIKNITARDDQKHAPFLVSETAECSVSYPPTGFCSKIASASCGELSPPAFAKSMQVPQQLHTSSAHQSLQIVSTSQKQHHQPCSTSKSLEQMSTTATTEAHRESLQKAEQAVTPSREVKKEVWDDPGDICPWEDEDSSLVDAPPFVKTYETLGYL